MNKEALKLALEALEDLGMKHFESTGEVLYKETFSAIKEALAQPLAYLTPTPSPENACYTPPQRTWVGLTDEEIDKAWRSCDYTVPWEQHRIDIARAIEAKLKEKNT